MQTEATVFKISSTSFRSEKRIIRRQAFYACQQTRVRQKPSVLINAIQRLAESRFWHWISAIEKAAYVVILKQSSIVQTPEIQKLTDSHDLR